jgi:hypothetical protein
VPAALAGVLGVVTLLLAVFGLGGPGPGADIYVTNAGVAGSSDEVRLADPLTVGGGAANAPLANARVTPSLVGVDLGSETTDDDGRFSLRGLRYVLAGPFETAVRSAGSGDPLPVVVRPAGDVAAGGLLSIPGVVGVALLMFAVAYAESFLRPLRRGGRPANGTLFGMGVVGLAAGAGAAVTGWSLAGHVLTMPLLLLTALTGLGACLALTVTLSRR